jgi:hypothetical protein
MQIQKTRKRRYIDERTQNSVLKYISNKFKHQFQQFIEANTLTVLCFDNCKLRLTLNDENPLIVNDRHQIKELLLRIIESGDCSECNSILCSLKVRFNTTMNMIAPETNYSMISFVDYSQSIYHLL